MGDKDMNNQKIVNLANPTDHQDAVTKKYMEEKTEIIALFTFLSKYANRYLFTETFTREKATY